MEDEFSLWHKKAKESLDDAISSLESHRYGLTAFCCQQASEKFLKAGVIRSKNQRPRKIHDLLPLLKDSGLEVSEDYVAEIAKQTLDKTKDVFLWIENKLKKS